VFVICKYLQHVLEQAAAQTGTGPLQYHSSAIVEEGGVARMPAQGGQPGVGPAGGLKSRLFNALGFNAMQGQPPPE
jgi:hypothetical protein